MKLGSGKKIKIKAVRMVFNFSRKTSCFEMVFCSFWEKKPLKLPSLARSVPKTLKVHRPARFVPNPFLIFGKSWRALDGSQPSLSTPTTRLWNEMNEMEANFGSLIFMKPLYVIRGSLIAKETGGTTYPS